MKLVYCVPAMGNPGGMEKILTDKINYLVEVFNFEVTIITTDQKDSPYFFSLNDKVNLIDFGLNFSDDFDLCLIKKLVSFKLKNSIYKKKLQNFLKDADVDICISLGGRELEFLYKLNTRAKKICEIHFAKSIRKQFITSRKKGKIWEMLGDIRTRQLIKQTKNVDQLVVLSKNDEKEWLKTNRNVTQIYNFTDIGSDKIAETKKKRVIAVGRLDAQKGFDLLIDAWQIVHEKSNDWKLDIFGQGEWKDLLTNKILDYKLQDVVSLKGVSKNIKKEFYDGSVFVLSSRYEGFGLVLLEAISCGLPSVSFNCDHGPAEMIEENSGILVEKENVTELAKGLLTLINDENLRTEMGINAKQKSLEFSKSIIMEQWKELFISLINIEKQ